MYISDDARLGFVTRVMEQSVSGGIAPNEVIARSEFEVHRQIHTE